MKKLIIATVVTIMLSSLYFYITLPSINIHTMSFWIFTILIVSVFSTTLITLTSIDNFNKQKIKTAEEIMMNKKLEKLSGRLFIFPIMVMFFIVTVNFIFGPIFNSSSYKERIEIDTTKTFLDDLDEADFSNLPLLDKDSSQKLGDRKMGEMPELVSQYYVSSLYTQLNYNETVTRVTPLEYNGFFKYLSNKEEGVLGYITVDSTTGESQLVKLNEGMKIMPSAYFSNDLYRTLRFKYPTKIFYNITFEVDEEGNPYWVAPVIKYTGVGLKEEVIGVVLLDPITGDSDYYEVSEAPKWVDHVYPSELILEEINDWGLYVNGFINSIFGQKEVVNTTDGYNYLTIDGDVHLYTGITSVASDESNLGFILVNLRTKEANYYSQPGAEEYSAMSSAEGLVQEKGYTSSFPLLINLNNRPTYLLSLKDAAGLVKMYAFVDVIDYQIVSASDSSLGIESASIEYLSKFSTEDKDELEEIEVTIKVKTITTAIINGNTHYYLTDNKNNKYEVSIIVDQYSLPFLSVGDSIDITYTDGDVRVIKFINN